MTSRISTRASLQSRGRGPSHPYTARPPAPYRGPDPARRARTGPPAVRGRPRVADRRPERDPARAGTAPAPARGPARVLESMRPVAATADKDKQLAWEARQRPRAGFAAVAGALGLVLFFVLQEILARNVPDTSLIASLQRAVQPGRLDKAPSLQVPIF